MPPIGTYRHRVSVQNPGAVLPDGDGGYTSGWADADPPTMECSITPATARDLERLAAGTTLTTATHLIRARWHPQITTSSQLIFRGRTLAVVYVGNPEERDREIVIVCAEVLPPGGAKAGRTAEPSSASPPPARAWDPV